MEEEAKEYPTGDQPRMAALELLRLVRDEGASEDAAAASAASALEAIETDIVPAEPAAE